MKSVEGEGAAISASVLQKSFDVLIVGSGAAGLSLALDLLPSGVSIAVMCKDELQEGSSFYAQGVSRPFSMRVIRWSPISPIS